MTVLLTLNNVFEKILASQLTSYFQNIFCDNLSAYRRHHSGQTTFMRLVEDWKKSRDKGEFVAIVTMDLSKAFDSLSHLLLIKKLQAYGFDGASLFFWTIFRTGYSGFRLETLCRHRTLGVEVYHKAASWDPLFFNVFPNDLAYFMTGTHLNAYADDQQLYHSDTDHLALGT